MKALRYTPFEHLRCPRPVDKLDWVSDFCANKHVLDLGAYDETAVVLKEGTGYWLHGRIAAAAKAVVGVDNSELLPADGLPTSATSVIVRGDILKLDQIQLGWNPEVVVAGELIEHLPNALQFLRLLKKDERLASSTVVLTTPNASAFYNFVLGLVGRESTHHDHLAIHSLKTLNTLCVKASLSRWEIIPYYSRFSELGLRSSGLARLAVIGFERVVNAIEYLCPLLGGGWIVKARL